MILAPTGGRATSPELQPVEGALMKATGAVASLWCGRGATAFYWGLRAAAAARVSIALPEVILPAVSCPVLADAARLAGWRARFADTDPHSGMLTPETVRLRLNARTRAVVFIHLFGQTADLGDLAAWCRHHDLLLIEDAAQALGARFPDGRTVGTVGDMVFYSFNRPKILGCGGGLLLVRQRSLGRSLESLAVRDSMPEAPPDAALLGRSARDLHHGLAALLRLGLTAKVSDLYLRLRKAYEPLCLRPMTDGRALAKGWNSLEEDLAQRRRKAEIYAEMLDGGPWRLLDGWRSSGVCWRYSLLFDHPAQTARFSEAVRENGFHVSNLYWPANQLMLPEDLCPAAESFARRVVNLWVDSEVDENRVRRCAQCLLREAQKFLN